MTRKDVFISSTFSFTIRLGHNQKDVRIELNPHKFLDRVRQDFEKYISDLRDPANSVLRQNFEKFMVSDKSVKKSK